MRWLKSLLSMPSLLRDVIAYVSGMLAVVLLLSSPLPAAAEDPDWLEEFEDICSQTIAGDSLSAEELAALVERIDAVLPVIEASDNPKKKVYVFRLKKCRSFFEYIMQLKDEERLEDELSP